MSDMNKIPIVDYRFSDKHLATWFIEVSNPAIQSLVKSWEPIAGDKFVEMVASYIRDGFIYPLTNTGQPACAGQLKRYKKGSLSGYIFSSCKYYVWGLVGETIVSGYAYCAESANLGTSIMLNKIPDAVTCLGTVMNLNDEIQGYHAWNQCSYRNELYVLETTIHTKRANNLAKTSSVYTKESDWAKQGGIYYKLLATMNDKEYSGDTLIATMMHLPSKFQATWNMKRTAKKYHKEHKILTELIKRAWGA